MKKNNLIRGNVKRAIALASTFMMMCNPVLGAPLDGIIPAQVEGIGAADRSKQVGESDPADESDQAGENDPVDESDEAGENDPADESDEAGENDPADESDEAGENDPADESEEAGENDPADESDEAGENDPADESDEAGENDPADESEEAGENDPADESDEAGENDPADESDEAGENDSADESEEAGENDPADESDEAGENDPADESDEAGENDPADESDEAGESDPADESGEAEKTEKPDEGSVTAGEKEPDGNTQQTAQNRVLMMLGDTSSWYIAQGSYVVEDDFYYFIDESGEKSIRIEKQFIEVGDYITYVDETGKPVKNKWLGNESDGFRYVNGEGKVIIDKDSKVAGGYFGDFDAEGYWTMREYEFFQETLKDGKEVTKYAGKEGKVAGVGEKNNRHYYCFETDETGVEKCFLLSKNDDSSTMELVADIWVEDLRVNPEGDLIKDAERRLIEDKYYNFDQEGHSSLICNEFIYDPDHKILCYLGDDGRKVTNQFVPDGADTYYFGEDGSLALHKWIDLGASGFRYIDGKGRMVVNDTRVAGGYYGTFDGDGYWTAIEYEFFENRLKDGSLVTKYAGEDGKVAGVGEKDERQYYFFVTDINGATECGLLSKEDTITELAVANLWIEDLWVDEAGYLITNAQNHLIGEKYYNFDHLGHGTLITGAFIYDADGNIVCCIGEDGNKVTSQFVSDGTYTYYFGADGAQAFHQWIDDAGRFRYVDRNGRMVVNAKKVVGGYYGTFDADGYWTAIEREFFESELKDGTPVRKYAGKGGEVAGVGDKGARQYYSFAEDRNGNMECSLIAADESHVTELAVSNVWIDDLWVNADGFLVRNAEEAVDGVYYYFDQDGHGSVVTYMITYVLNGGTNSGLNPFSYTGAMDTFVLEAPTRAGYTFGGWFTTPEFTTPIAEIASKSHGAMTLYARWIRNSSSDSGSSDSGSSDSGSGSSDSGSSDSGSASSSASNTENTAGTTVNSNPSAITVAIGEGQNVVVQTGGVSVSAAAVQTAEGSVSGNTIVSVAEKVTIPVADGQVAEVATIAVGTDGSARSLLASPVQGATVQQVTVMVQGVVVTQNVVVYADGTQVTQKSGVTELEGFAETVASTEQAIQNGTQTIANVYHDKVDIDLHQYTQVGAAVTYAITPGVNGAVPQTQMEQTSFVPGQEIIALITDANGNVKAVTLMVGANGIVQYEIPGVNCIVRFMRKNG